VKRAPNALEQLERAAQLPDDSRYILLNKLGQGGMGQVWLAEKLGPDGSPFRTVVLKTVIPHGSEAEVRRRQEMFMREMAVAAKLEHPNVVRVTDWGADLFGSTHFFEMERIKGISLLALLAARGTPLSEEDKWGALPPQDVAWVGMQAAAGLHYAHTHARTGEGDEEIGGVAHRDVTPDNLMVDIEGVVKVADWGITKALNAAGEASKTDMIAGKVKYMAPEQLRGQIDTRADVYGLGTTLTVALAGKPVFAASPSETWESIAMRVLQGERPTVAELAPDAPPALRDLLERMMHVDREQRPSMGELVDQFARLAEQLGGSLHEVKKAFAARVREHHKEGKRTRRAIDSAQRDVPTHSTRRPISAATQPEAGPAAAAPAPAKGSTQPLPMQATAPSNPGAAAPAVAAPATDTPGSSRRPLLIGALALGLLVLLALIAAVAGFMFGDFGTTGDPAPSPPVAQPADPTPEPPTPTATSEGTAEEASLEAQTEVAVEGTTPAEPDPEPTTEPTEAEPSLPSQQPPPTADTPAEPRQAAPRRGRRPRPPTPAPRPLAPQPAPQPQQQRATERTPGLSDLGF